jgi:hypothetical protein
MREKKSKIVCQDKKIVYPQDDEKNLTQEERNTKRINELIRRVDKITADLYPGDSKCALKKIEDHERRLDGITWHLVMNDNEFNIFKDIISDLQHEVNPDLEEFIRKASQSGGSNPGT